MGDFSFFSCQGWESGVLTSLGCGGRRRQSFGALQGKEPTRGGPVPGGILHVGVLLLKGGGVGTCGRET